MTPRYHIPLSPEEQIAQGMSAPQTLAIADKVRFAEIDALNHVNNKAYMTWFETLRVRYFDLFGERHYPEGTPLPRIVLRSGTVHYIREMLMDEDYITTCAVSAYRRTSCTMHQELWAGGTLRATFDCVVVMLYPDGTGRYPLPEGLTAQFASEGAEAS